MKAKIGFVILHYNAIKETIDCVNSIVENIDTDDFKIVIVDNKSLNGTGKELDEKYKEHDKVKVILNDVNAGFARGNNLGYQYMVKNYDPDFICVMNNDTLVIQKDFLKIICDEYEKSKFGVLGPRIILKDGSDNRLYVKFPTLDFLKDEYKLQRRELFLMKYHLDHFVTAFKMARNYLYKLLGKKRPSRYGGIFTLEGVDKRHEHLVLHGCCLIFSRRYMDIYEDAFCPDTFVYREEELLYLRGKKSKLPMIYNPELLIKHLEDVATETVMKKPRKKIMFQKKHESDSIKILIGVMEEMKC